MPLARFRIDVHGDVQLSRAFEATAEELEDMSEPLARIGRDLRREVGEQFLTEGAHGGSPWQPLDRAYSEWKDQHAPGGPGLPILVFSGDMRAAALSEDSVHVTEQRMVYEIDDEKAIWHQEGAGSLPARRIVELNLAFRRGVERTFAEWLNAVRRAQGIG